MSSSTLSSKDETSKECHLSSDHDRQQQRRRWQQQWDADDHDHHHRIAIIAKLTYQYMSDKIKNNTTTTTTANSTLERSSSSLSIIKSYTSILHRCTTGYNNSPLLRVDDSMACYGFALHLFRHRHNVPKGGDVTIILRALIDGLSSYGRYDEDDDDRDDNYLDDDTPVDNIYYSTSSSDDVDEMSYYWERSSTIIAANAAKIILSTLGKDPRDTNGNDDDNDEDGGDDGSLLFDDKNVAKSRTLAICLGLTSLAYSLYRLDDDDVTIPRHIRAPFVADGGLENLLRLSVYGMTSRRTEQQQQQRPYDDDREMDTVIGVLASQALRWIPPDDLKRLRCRLHRQMRTQQQHPSSAYENHPSTKSSYNARLERLLTHRILEMQQNSPTLDDRWRTTQRTLIEAKANIKRRDLDLQKRLASAMEHAKAEAVRLELQREERRRQRQQRRRQGGNGMMERRVRSEGGLKMMNDETTVMDHSLLDRYRYDDGTIRPFLKYVISTHPKYDTIDQSSSPATTTTIESEQDRRQRLINDERIQQKRAITTAAQRARSERRRQQKIQNDKRRRDIQKQHDRERDMKESTKWILSRKRRLQAAELSRRLRQEGSDGDKKINDRHRHRATIASRRELRRVEEERRQRQMMLVVDNERREALRAAEEREQMTREEEMERWRMMRVTKERERERAREEERRKKREETETKREEFRRQKEEWARRVFGCGRWVTREGVMVYRDGEEWKRRTTAKMSKEDEREECVVDGAAERREVEGKGIG